jgi:hypothetical protein
LESIHSERVKWGFNGGFVGFGKEKAFAEESGGGVVQWEKCRRFGSEFG